MAGEVVKRQKEKAVLAEEGHVLPGGPVPVLFLPLLLCVVVYLILLAERTCQIERDHRFSALIVFVP